MIVVSGEFEIRREDLEAVREVATTMMRETARENGCIVYRFSQDIEFPTHIRIYEEWVSEEALKAHFSAPHMKVFNDALSKMKIVSRRLKKFEAGPAIEL
jgi:quinol monooxygenase YgiN